MSKIFEAIQKGSGGASEILPELLGEQPIPEKPIESAPRMPVPEVIPTPAAAPVVHAAPHVVAPVEPRPASLPSWRTLPLQVQSDAPILIFDQQKGRAGEQYRILRTKVLHHPTNPHLILVSSPGPGDGKTVTAINLAGALSLKTESKVLLIDSDFRRSSVHKELGFPLAPGLSDVLAGSVTLEQAVIRTEQYPSLYVMTAGEGKRNPSELLDSAVWRALVERLRKEFQYIILDSPPIAAVADYLLLQEVCDGVLVVIRPDHTSRKMCKATLETVPREKLMGAIMNCVEDWFLAGVASSSGYYYYGSEEN
jgi:capsular exopolysaccharide synthesis family protein